jgi:hypothetical protein
MLSCPGPVTAKVGLKITVLFAVDLLPSRSVVLIPMLFNHLFFRNYQKEMADHNWW